MQNKFGAISLIVDRCWRSNLADRPAVSNSFVFLVALAKATQIYRNSCMKAVTSVHYEHTPARITVGVATVSHGVSRQICNTSNCCWNTPTALNATDTFTSTDRSAQHGLAVDRLRRARS